MIRDLDTLGGTTGFANWISDAGDVAGTASNQGDQALHAFLWKNGTMTDLEIVASGVLPNGDPRAVLLIPCDENHPNIDGCEYSLLDTSSQAITHVCANRIQNRTAGVVAAKAWKPAPYLQRHEQIVPAREEEKYYEKRVLRPDSYNNPDCCAVAAASTACPGHGRRTPSLQTHRLGYVRRTQ